MIILHVCRYEPGQRFNRHYDDSVDMGNGLRTAYTLLMYLSGQEHGMQGGETVFYSHGERTSGAIRYLSQKSEQLAQRAQQGERLTSCEGMNQTLNALVQERRARWWQV